MDLIHTTSDADVQSEQRDFSFKPLDSMDSFESYQDEPTLRPARHTLLLVEDEDMSSEEEEEGSTLSSDKFFLLNKDKVDSIRKTRPLPQLPSRNKEGAGAFVDVKKPNRIAAQELFQMLSKHQSELEENGGDTSDEDEEYGGVFALKTQMPSPKLSAKEQLHLYYHEHSYKLMTPVEEVDEEDQLFNEVSSTDSENEDDHDASVIKRLSDISLEDATSGRTTPLLTDDSPRTSLEYAQQRPSLERPSSYSPLQAMADSSPQHDKSLLSDVQKLAEMSKSMETPTVSPSLLPSQAAHLSPSSSVKLPEMPTPSSSNSSIASISLTHDIKTYRRMAEKTHDRHIQFTFATYLIQLVNSNDEQLKKPAREKLQVEAEYWIEKLAKSDYAKALYIKGKWHHDLRSSKIFVGSQYKKVNHAKAFKCFQKAAKYGSIDAHYELAEYWMVRKEYKKSISSYRYAASKNHVQSLYKLANVLLRGLLNQSKDIQQGIIYLRRAADVNKPESAQSAFDLACIFSNDLESVDLERTPEIDVFMTAKNYAAAVDYFKKADQYGLVNATYRLGHIYEMGLNYVAPDPWVAFKYFSRAAERRHEGAMMNLSRIYRTGIVDCLRPRPDLAYSWCLRVANNGNEVAEYTLGLYYERGVGVNIDLLQATEWFRKSASKGYQPANEKLSILMPNTQSKGYNQVQNTGLVA
ncbi:Protein SKT5 [Choanephora cucurbitarum]|uniref:Protein SKT5 n=1 Tax=Choanephora cucurbitarum TaxID=101091 RepID=A0A1C7N1A1_9FUNG|nr:Protein SKT5 [Choanephora cucurbitarum]